MSLYSIRKISDILYAIREPIFGDSFPITIYLILGRERAALIDTGLGCDNLMEAVQSVTNLPVIVLHTHAHGDHVGADAQFETIYLNEGERRLTGEGYDFAKSAEKKLAFIEPAIGSNAELRDYVRAHMLEASGSDTEYLDIDDGNIVDLGGIRMKAILTPGHTPFSLSYVDEESRFAFTGDGIADIHWFDANASTVEDFRDTLDHFIENAHSVDCIYAAHLPQPFTMELVHNLREAANAIAEGSDDPIENADYQFLKHGRLRTHRAGQATIYYADAYRHKRRKRS